MYLGDIRINFPVRVVDHFFEKILTTDSERSYTGKLIRTSPTQAAVVVRDYELSKSGDPEIV